MNLGKRTATTPLADDECSIPQAFLFYFPSDSTYSVIGVQHRAWPSAMTMTQKIRLNPKDAVHLRLKNEVFEAFFLCFGKLYFLLSSDYKILSICLRI